MSSDSIRAIVCLSGGMDSSVCAALAVRDFGADAVAALHISYGQRTESREQTAFRGICERLGIGKRLIVRTAVLSRHWRIGADRRADCRSRCWTGNRQPNTCDLRALPQRPFSVGRSELGGGAGRGTHLYWSGAAGQLGLSGLPSRSFISAFNAADACRHKGRPHPDRDAADRACASLEIVTRGLELGAPFDLTWSCYSRDDLACGSCDSCVLRLRAFAAAGAVDPIPYLSPTAVQDFS